MACTERKRWACSGDLSRLPLSAPGRPVRVLAPVVQVAARVVPSFGQHLAVRDAVAAQPISNQAPRLVLQPSEQAPEEALGRSGVAPFLRKDVEYNSVLVHGSPEVVHLAADAYEHLIHVPCIPPDRGRRFRSLWAMSAPNLRHHWRTLSWVTTMPRSARISSTSRRLKLKT